MIAAAFVFLWMDLPTGEMRGDWSAPDEPAAVGSLVKPFTALAYAQSHGFEYPEVTCHRCWSGRAHGKLGIVRAVAVSCNTYFHELAGAAAGVAQLVSRLGLAAPPDSKRDTLIGTSGAWRLSGKALLRAYVELVLRRNEPGVKELWEGMRESARSGTGKAIGGDALVKTGTAKCVHGGAPGDGYAVALAPVEKPRTAVLVRVHSQPGSEAARIAGELMKKGRGINPRPSVLSAR